MIKNIISFLVSSSLLVMSSYPRSCVLPDNMTKSSGKKMNRKLIRNEIIFTGLVVTWISKRKQEVDKIINEIQVTALELADENEPRETGCWFHRRLFRRYISWGNTASWLRIYPVKISSFNLWNQHVINKSISSTSGDHKHIVHLVN
jgi:hypothetical protein